MEIIEVIRRWQAGESARSIARASGVARNSVDKYLRLAKAAGVQQDGEPPGEEVVRQLVAQSRPGPRPGSVAAPGRTMLEERRERIATWLQEDRLQLTRVHELLLRDGVAVSYTTLREFARDAGLRQPPTTTLRMAQWPPGEVAEIDFGKLGSIVEVESGKRQAVWALVVVLP
jgi:transposase